MKSAESSRGGAVFCCFLALAGAELWGLSGLSSPLWMPAFYLLFYVLPAHLGAFGAQRMLPFGRCGANLLLAALAGLAGSLPFFRLTEIWSGFLAARGVFVPFAPAPQTGLQLLLLLFVSCLVPAIAEEYLLRGVLQPSVGNGIKAIVYASLVFALLHGNAAGLPVSLLCGVVLGFMAQRSGRLLPCMAYHFCHNAGVVLLSFAVQRGFAPPDIAALACSLLCALLLFVFFRRLRREPLSAPCAAKASPVLCAALLAVLLVRQLLLL